MRNKGILSGILCFLLILTVSIVPMVAFAADGNSQDTDYSKEGSYFNTVYSAGDVLRSLGYEVSDAEYDYLKEYGGLNIKYEEVTTQHVRVETYDGNTKVIASPYSYVSRQGNMLTWTPQSASVDGVSAPLVYRDGHYVADFGDIAINDDTAVQVEYSLDKVFNISKDDINGILNLAYNDADDISLVISSTKAEYDAKKQAYDQFCAEYPAEISKYYSDLALYKQYQVDKLAYDERNALYQAYLSQFSQFELDKAVYDQYLIDLEAYNTAYDNNLNYDANYAKYEQDLQKYNAYLAERAVVKAQLDALDAALFDKVTTLDRQLYSSIKSGLVDQVIEKKEIFVTLGAKEAVIDNCEKATGVLRRLLDQYKGLKTEKEKYEFYKQNYVELRDNMILLTQALENLYSVGTIAKVMVKAERTDKFVIFVSQLIICSNILSDEPVRDFTNTKDLNTSTTISYYKHDGNSKVTEDIITILEGNEYAKATTYGAPLANGYPKELAEPNPPVMMEVPPKPDDIARPIEPEEVGHPGDAPEVVAEPETLKYSNGDPVLEPERPEILDNDIYLNLVSAYESGIIASRADVSEGYFFTPTKTVTKKLKGTDSVTVSFTDAYGDVIASVVVDKNTAASFVGEIPTKAEDFNGVYTFSHWVDADGNAYDLSDIKSNITLYPCFNSELKKYDVEYNVNNSGLNYLIVRDTDRVLTYTEIENLLIEASNKSVGIIFYASNVTLKIENRDVKTMIQSGITAIDAEIDLSNPKAYKLRVSLREGREESDVQFTFDVSIPCADSEFARIANITYTSADGKLSYTNKSYKDGRVSFKATTDVDYTMCVRYAVNIRQDFETGIDSTDKNIILSTDMAIPGDTVTLDIPNIPGVNVEVYYYNQSGEKQQINGGSFEMPNYIVSIHAKFTRIVYTVTFMNGNEVVSTGRYYYGETVIVPGNPTKSNDNKYSYEFSGWSPEVSETVTEDVTYQAQYDATEIIDEEEKEKGKFWIMILALISAIIFLLTGVLVFFSLKRRKQSPINPESACKETDEKADSEEKKHNFTEKLRLMFNRDKAENNAKTEVLNTDADNVISEDVTPEEQEVIYVDEFGGELLPNVDCDIKNEAEMINATAFEVQTEVSENDESAELYLDAEKNTADERVPDVNVAEAFLNRVDEAFANTSKLIEELENDTKTEAETIESGKHISSCDADNSTRVEGEAYSIQDIASIKRDYEALYNTRDLHSSPYNHRDSYDGEDLAD